MQIDPVPKAWVGVCVRNACTSTQFFCILITGKLIASNNGPNFVLVLIGVRRSTSPHLYQFFLSCKLNSLCRNRLWDANGAIAFYSNLDRVQSYSQGVEIITLCIFCLPKKCKNSVRRRALPTSFQKIFVSLISNSLFASQIGVAPKRPCKYPLLMVSDERVRMSVNG